MIFHCPRCKRGKIQYRSAPDETEEERFRRLYYIEVPTGYVSYPDYIFSRNCLECDWKETITKETFQLAVDELRKQRRDRQLHKSRCEKGTIWRVVYFYNVKVGQSFSRTKPLDDQLVWKKLTPKVAAGPNHMSLISDLEFVWVKQESTVSMDNNDQPMPTKTEEVTTYELVHKDLDARKALGIKKYGVALQPNNGRDSLQDAYEEILDAAVYVRNQIAKNNSEGSDKAELSVMRGRYKAVSEILESRTAQLERVKRDNERLSTQLNQLNGELYNLRGEVERRDSMPNQDKVVASQAAALVRASEDVAELRRENQKLKARIESLTQTAANENNRIRELLEKKLFPAEVWNIVTQAFYYGWNHRTEHHPADKTTVLNMCRAKMKEIFKHVEFPDVPR